MACDKLLLVHDSQVTEFDGDIDSYPGWLQKQSRPASTGKQATETTARPDKDQKRVDAENRQRLAPLRKEISALIYETDKKEQLKDLLWQQAELAKATQSVEEEWMEKAEQLEQAQQQ